MSKIALRCQGMTRCFGCSHWLCCGTCFGSRVLDVGPRATDRCFRTVRKRAMVGHLGRLIGRFFRGCVGSSLLGHVKFISASLPCPKSFLGVTDCALSQVEGPVLTRARCPDFGGVSALFDEWSSDQFLNILARVTASTARPLRNLHRT